MHDVAPSAPLSRSIQPVRSHGNRALATSAGTGAGHPRLARAHPDYPGRVILGIDTSLGTAVGIVDADGTVRADVASADTRGHAEVIGTLIAQALADAGVSPLRSRMSLQAWVRVRSPDCASASRLPALSRWA